VVTIKRPLLLVSHGKILEVEMQSVPMDQLVGKDAGIYHIARLLGQGPVSSFYEAQHASGQKVILTLFTLPATFDDHTCKRFIERFKQEGTRLVRLQHPAILPVYDYGICMGYPYLATPFVPGSSLAQVLRAYGRVPLEPTLEILKQVADGLDYASRNGIVHGALSPANILVGQERGAVQIAGFGLTRILTQQGLELQETPQAHLLNIAGTFLMLPAYMAPEIIQGAACSASTDLYALGVLLFELLSGERPFSGETPLEVAQQEQQPVPALSALVPAVPTSVDAVMRKALAVTPEARFQSAGEFVCAFEQALQEQPAEMQPAASIASITQGPVERTDVTGPLTIDWQAENGAMADEPGEAKARIAQQATLHGLDPFGKLELTSPNEAKARIAQQATLPGLDPFAWWTNVSATQTVSHPQADKSASAGTQKARSPKRSRRSVVALLTVGSVVVAGLGGGGFVLARSLQQREAAAQLAAAQAQKRAQAATPTTQPVATPTSQPSPTARPTTKPKATTQAATPTPTTPPAPTPTPTPGHTGTVIASTSMAPNSAVNFSGGNDILIHLSGGNFAAYNRACTHQQVPVNYDPGSQQLVCPAHGARFSASSGSVVKGPAHKPLSAVPIRVNGDGTITV
jgi:serine/threonine protein kinase/nitrite reductase/ring-hydroxylating ferredoxin subunit